MAAKNSYYGTGRRKSAVARVWIFKGEKGFTVNGRETLEYLKRAILKIQVEEPLKVSELADQFRVRATVNGGGIRGQAGAISLGLSRALLAYDENLRTSFRRGGLLTRDPREKERKKAGKKGARRSFQFTKR